MDQSTLRELESICKSVALEVSPQIKEVAEYAAQQLCDKLHQHRLTLCTPYADGHGKDQSAASALCFSRLISLITGDLQLSFYLARSYLASEEKERG